MLPCGGGIGGGHSGLKNSGVGSAAVVQMGDGATEQNDGFKDERSDWLYSWSGCGG